ncbi:hypothetical protein [Brevundimonas sp.]|jgi:hypothetical protein|uniref:hypothetical protein n=1 Tax=Brevundimonas sp. TaxID=1871086 RepID=UPI0037852EE7
MTLKEKFALILMEFWSSDWEGKCEQVADEFAIGFGEWIRKETYYEHLTKEFIYKRNVYESEKELLEIYKKEKGL